MSERNAKLGRGFGTLWTAATISGLGDGVTQIAGSLLALSLTRSPLRIAGLLMAQQLPWVLFALPVGAVVDQVDRRLAMATACAVRVAAVGSLGLLVLAAHAGMPLLYMVFVLVGCAGLGYENASVAALPALVERGQLDRANGRLQSAAALSRSLLAQPLGGWLFAIAPWAPFLLDAAALVLVTMLTAVLPAGTSVPRRAMPRVPLRAAMRDGVRWLADHRLLRTLALAAAVSNVGLGAVFSVFVLIARVRLGIGPVGYSLLLAAVASGGLIGGLLAGRVVAAIGAGTALRVELAVETLSYLGLLLIRDAAAAAALLALLAMHLTIFSAVSASLRQSLAPPDMLGRVQGSYRAVSNGGMLAGAALGGILTSVAGLTAPFWVGLAGMAVVLSFAWPALSNRQIRMATGANASSAWQRHV
jgi:predicted MFS family arabinose efflux permease